MERSFGFPNVDKGGALFTCYFVYDISGFVINLRSNVIGNFLFQWVTLNWKEYIMSRVALVAVVSGLDIGLSQWSLEYVTLSLYTMTKTTSTPFILFFGLVLKLERKVRNY